ncbi:MAG: hypothetical protein IPK62_03995 [Bacteroidetes bacterium]|nr:hypothetical protein [Bacteroidota bacterium]
MKKLLHQKLKPILFLLFVQLSVTPLWAQNESKGLGMPGDNLNLSAVLDMFQQSKTLEAFESSLNSNGVKSIISRFECRWDGRLY